MNQSIRRIPASILLAAIAAAILTSSAWAAPNRAGYIVVLKDSVDNPAALAHQQADNRDAPLDHIYTAAINGYAAKLTPKQAAELESNPKVKYVERDQPIKLFAQKIPTGIERAFALKNPLPDIDGEDDVRIDADVAVIDTAVDFAHEDLNIFAKSEPKATYAWVNCLEAAPLDKNPENDDCKAEVVKDGFGHGTHVAGTVGAIDNGLGVVGIAPGVRLWSAKVFTDTGSSGPTGLESAVLAAFNWVYEHAEEIEVVNMSFGGTKESKAWQEAIAKTVDKGVVFVAAAGNENADASEFTPAKFSDVITVSALADFDGLPGKLGKQTCENQWQSESDDSLAHYSNWGSVVDIAAPGSCIYSTLPMGGSVYGTKYGLISGTSMASPHVAGAAALLASKANPNSRKDVEAVRQTLIAEGSLNWTDDSEDGAQEPLLDLRPPTPEAITLKASELQTHGAKLAGVVNAGGLESSYRFEYGLTDQYGTKAPASSKSIGSGISDLEVSETVSVEKPDTIYHYRIALTNSKGTFYGEDKTLKTSLWSLQSIPPPSEPDKGGSLLDVSCASSTSCIAVGRKSVPTKSGFYSEATFAEHWNGIGWSIMTTPIPSGATSSSLEDVSCGSANSCIAIGRSSDLKIGPTLLSANWNGSEWSLQTVPVPSGAMGIVKWADVSCASTTFCIAVGSYPTDLQGKKSTLVELWNGKEWTIQASPNFEGYDTSELIAVSCRSSSNCMAVGGVKKLYYEEESVPKAMRWDGSNWSAKAAPISPADGGELAHISCRSSTFCMAVGNSFSKKEGFINFWDGTEWHMQSSGLPSVLSDVNCAGESSCDILGTAKGTGELQGFGQHWDGIKWSEQAPAPPANGKAFTLTSLSCPGSCTAVGFSGSAPMAESLPPSWSQSPSFSLTFGKVGTGEGQFQFAKGIALGLEGHIWVTDGINNRVQEFNAEGTYLNKFGSSGSEKGQFKNPSGITIGPEGHIWIVDSGNKRVQEFNTKGEYISQFGKEGKENGQFGNPLGLGFMDIAFDATGNLWVVDTGNHRLQKFNTKGEYISQVGKEGTGNGQLKRPAGLAIDSDGDLWVADTGNHRVQQFNTKGEYLSQFGSLGAGNEKFNEPHDLVVDSSDSIWVADTNHSRVQEFYPEGEYVTQFGNSGSGNGQFQGTVGIATTPTGRLWVVDMENYRVQAWDQAPQAPVFSGAATSIKRSEVMLNGTINPEGVATSYQFEYGTTASFDKVAPASSKSIGSGTGPVKVSETISGLKAATTYYYRVVASSEKGITYGETRYFKTLVPPPPGAAWRIGSKTLAELKLEKAAFSSQGTFAMEIPTLLTTFNCTETGTGTISGTNKLEESITLNCKDASQEKCVFEPISLKFSGTNAEAQPASKVFLLKLKEGSGCNWVEQQFTLPSTFFPEVGSDGVKLPVNTFATGTYGSNAMYYSGFSTWMLTGANAGKEVGIW